MQEGIPEIVREENIRGYSRKRILLGGRKNIMWGIGSFDAKMQDEVCQRRSKKKNSRSGLGNKGKKTQERGVWCIAILLVSAKGGICNSDKRAGVGSSGEGVVDLKCRRVGRRLVKKRRSGVVVAKKIYGEEGELTQTVTARGCMLDTDREDKIQCWE